MPIFKYKIRCSKCDSETFLVGEEYNPIIFKCNGCMHMVIVDQQRVYTVTEDFFNEIYNKHGVKYCGQVVACACNKAYGHQKPSQRKGSITEGYLNKLHDLLVNAEDSSDIIENL